MTTTSTDDRLGAAAEEVDSALQRLIDVVGGLDDGDLHRAHFDGGWTVAQVISHLNVCTIMWQGDLRRLEDDPDLTFFFREEIGHDLTGYPPPTVEIATRQLAATRRTLAQGLARLSPELLDRTVEIPDLGTMTIAEWTPLITGHLVMHTGQASEILVNRGVLSAED